MHTDLHAYGRFIYHGVVFASLVGFHLYRTEMFRGPFDNRSLLYLI